MFCASSRNPSSHTVVAALLATLLGIAVSASASESPFLIRLLDLYEQVELSLYYAKAALLVPGSDTAYVGELERLILTPEITSDDPGTLAGRTADLLTSVGNLAVDARMRAEIASALETVRAYAERTVAEIAVLPTEGSPRTAALRRIHGYLVSMHGGIPFALPGLTGILARLPNAERRAVPDDNLQEHIDALLPGGTLLLGAGTYALSEGLVLDRSMTVRAAPGAENAVILTMDAGGGGAVVSIASTAAASVHLRDLTLRGGAIGIAIGEVDGIVTHAPLEVVLDTVSILDGGRAAVRLAWGEVELVDCTLQGFGEYGLLVPWSGSAQLTRCVVADNGSEEIVALGHRTCGGIDVRGVGSIELHACRVANNAGTGLRLADRAAAALFDTELRGNVYDGILALDAASLHLETCTIAGNGGFGARFDSPACAIEGEGRPTATFSGTVTGGSNAIADLAVTIANARGAVCPALYSFLADSN